MRIQKSLENKQIPTVLTSAFHLTNLFLFSRHHTPTNSVAPLSAYKPTHNPQFLQSLDDKGLTLEMSAFYSLQWPIYVFNSVVNTKLPAILSRLCSTKVSLETYPL